MDKAKKETVAEPKAQPAQSNPANPVKKSLPEIKKGKKAINKPFKPNPQSKTARGGRGKKGKEPPEKELFLHFGKRILNYKLEEQDLDNATFLKYNVIGILFTGTWVPPAREFMQKLTELYKEVNATEKVFEIVQISNEKTEKDYKEAITEERPWLYLPFNDSYVHNLVEQYKVEFLPTFIIVNREMFVLSDNGRRDMVENEGVKAYEKWYKAYRTRKEELQKEKEDKEENEGSEGNLDEEPTS